MSKEEKEQQEFSHEYSIPNFALACPYLDLSKPPDEVLGQLRGIASYGVFGRERAGAAKKIKEMNVAELLKGGKK